MKIKVQKQKAEKNGIVNKLNLFMKAYAEEVVPPVNTEPTPPTPQPQPTPQPTINYEELIKQARKEEKDKLYPTIQKLEKEAQNNVIKVNDLLMANAQLTIEKNGLAEELSNLKLKGDSEEVTNLKEEIKELKGKLENGTDEEALRQQIKAEYELKYFKDTKISEVKGEILSHLVDTITGDTEEEITASIENAKAKTLEIKKELGIKDTPETKSKPKPSKTPPNRVPPKGNPTVSINQDIYTTEYIQNLDPSSEEYKEFRKTLGLK